MSDIQNSILGEVGDIFSDISDIFSSIGRVFEFLLDPHSYVRIFEVIFGSILIIGALKYGRA